MDVHSFVSTLKKVGVECEVRGVDHLILKGVAADTRSMLGANMFVAIPGLRFNPLDSLDAMFAAGIRIILSSHYVDDDRFTWILAPSDIGLLSAAAEICYPEKPQVMVGVTGTNGKTTVVELMRQLWVAQGINAASLGTLGLCVADHVPVPGLTTPDALTLRQTFQELVARSVSHLAMEVSSHGLDQGRVSGLCFQASVFTNLSQDHLDYHHDMAQYLEAKLRLLREHTQENALVVTATTGSVAAKLSDVANNAGLRLWNLHEQDERMGFRTYGHYSNGTEIEIRFAGNISRVLVPFLPGYQCENLALAAASLLDLGFPFDGMMQLLPSLKTANGRLEYVGKTQSGGQVFVDFAHTADALEKVLKTLRATEKFKKIGLVFGCGGNRDQGKRPLMGKVASDLADFVIITDDNPRHEDPYKIRQEIAVSCPSAQICGDRKQAIREGLDQLGAQDALLIAGKGHETGQIYGSEYFPFSDKEVASQWLES